MAKFSIKVSDFQQAKMELQKELEKIRPTCHVTVGFHVGQKADKVHKDSGQTIVQIARLNHYGTKNIPARPFLDVSITEKQDYLANTLRRDLEKGLPVDQALERVGNRAVGIVQSYITELRTPPNAPSTIKAKGSSNPLIDTGEMLGAVTYKVQSE